MSLDPFIELLVNRVAPLVISVVCLRSIHTPGLALYVAVSKFPILPLYPVSLLALYNCGWDLLAGLAGYDNMKLGLLDTICLTLVQLTHMILLSHQFDIDYWRSYFVGALIVGHPAFCLSSLRSLMPSAHKAAPKKVMWANHVFALIETTSILAIAFLVLRGMEGTTYGIVANSWVTEKGLGLGNLPSNGFAESLGERYIQGSLLLNFLQIVMFAVPRITITENFVLTWLLRLLLVVVAGFSGTLALTLFISYSLLWPNRTWGVTVKGVKYGMK